MATAHMPAKVERQHAFTELGLHGWLVAQCASMGLHEPTAVQLACVPPALSGSDVVGCARTGTGKTLAFALPILHRLADDPYGVFALVLTPTRELAFQIADQFRVLGKPIGVQSCVVVGGRDMVEQSKDISRRPHILVATPGRLMDHIRSGHEMPLRRLRFLVLDEADRLLDGQYEEQLAAIFAQLPPKRQTLLFSATMTDALERARSVAAEKPFCWQDETLDGVATVAELEQRYVLCPVRVKDAYVVYAVMRFHYKQPQGAVLIFANSCRECQALSFMFRDLGFKQCGALHSLVSQQERLRALARFRSNRTRILLCTDVAARGLDIPHVDLVVNHDVPALAKTYVHRVGRAARAGRLGAAWTFVTPHDIKRVQAVEALTGCRMQRLPVSDAKVAQCVTEVLVAKREAEIRLDKEKFGEQREVNRRKQLLLAGVDPDSADAIVERQRQRRTKDSRRRVRQLKNQALPPVDNDAGPVARTKRRRQLADVSKRSSTKRSRTETAT